MQESDVKELFGRFAAPLAAFVAVGARKESAEELARNLWVAMLAGKNAERRMWRALADTDAGLCEIVKRCYLEEMKPLVSHEELSALRQKYGFSGDAS